MRFELTVNLGNAAFTDSPKEELGRILRVAADAVERGESGFDIRDSNGNKVGHAVIWTPINVAEVK